MRISVLISDLSTNCIVRSWPIIKVLQRQHTVEVIGSLFGDDQPFPPYADEFSYRIVRWERRSQVACGVKRLADQVTGDLVYAFKPLTASFGVALLAKWRRRLPVILDVEDWEASSIFRNSGTWRHPLTVGRQLIGHGWLDPNSQTYRYAMEWLVGLADEVTVVSKFLQRRFGGVMVFHGPDTKVFDPSRYDRRQLREKWGLDQDTPLILFAGTPSLYKGLDDILAALEALKGRAGSPVRLLMVGRNTDHAYTRELLAKAGESILHLGPQPHTLMPELLSLSDMVALPQRRTSVTNAQIPGKVFEAMAMGKPVIASAVSDLAEILDGCGILVEPENVPELTGAIERLLADQAGAEEMGRKARERCERLYSWDTMETTLSKVIERFI